MRRRLRRGLVAGLVLLAAGASLAASPAATSPTIEAVKERGSITVGTKFDQPLFGQLDAATGKPVGFDVEIAKLVVKRVFGAEVARNITFVETPSKTRESAITSGAADLVVATYTITPERDAVIDFAGPYTTSGQSVMVQRTNRDIEGVADLGGKKVCTVTGSTSASNLAAKAPTAVPVLLDTYSACVAALGAGEVDAVTTDEGILLGYLASQPGKFRIAGPTFTTEQYGIGIPQGDTELARRIDAALLQAFRDGSWKRAWKRTVGKSGATAPAPPTADLRQAIKSLPG